MRLCGRRYAGARRPSDEPDGTGGRLNGISRAHTAWTHETHETHETHGLRPALGGPRPCRCLCAPPATASPTHRFLACRYRYPVPGTRGRRRRRCPPGGATRVCPANRTEPPMREAGGGGERRGAASRAYPPTRERLGFLPREIATTSAHTARWTSPAPGRTRTPHRGARRMCGGERSVRLQQGHPSQSARQRSRPNPGRRQLQRQRQGQSQGARQPGQQPGQQQQRRRRTQRRRSRRRRMRRRRPTATTANTN